MAWVALVTLLSLLVYLGMAFAVGRARGLHHVPAPAMTGHPVVERMLRVQANTLEWLPLYLGSLWLFALYGSPRWAAGLGVVWIIGRILYAAGYARDPAGRAAGFMVQGAATLVLLAGALVGVVRVLMRHG